jgi:predicted outer membrane repeat protein
MRYLVGFVCVLALGVMPMVGCGETGGPGGNGGSAGVGGMGGGGTGGTDLCQGVDCDDGNECTEDLCADGVCDNPAVEDGTACGQGPGACEAGACVGGVFPCTEQGIRDAIFVGGGPHTFDCDGPQTVPTQAEIVIDNDVILDGEGNLSVDGGEDHRVFSVLEGVTAELRGFGVTGGTVHCSAGAGISNAGALTLTDSSVSGNTGTGDCEPFTPLCCGAHGIGIYNVGSLELAHTTVSGNDGWFGGGIVNDGTLTMTSSSVTANSGGGIANDGTLTMTNSTVSDNTSRGVNNVGTLTMTSSVVSGNAGGGVSNIGTLTMTNSTASDNTGRDGGGIYAEGTVTVTNSTVSGNSATVRGGGIHAGGTVTVTNSTVSGNTAAYDDAGIYVDGLLTLVNSIVVGDGQGSSIYVKDPDFGGDPAIELRGTLVDGGCEVGGPGGIGELITSSGHNIESPGDTCGFDQGTDLVNITEGQLDLGALADNGGPTMTHALGAGSVAIDVIPADMCEVDEDQRGFPRDSMCDVGAFEVQP